MPIPFSIVCELLDEAYALCLSRKDHKAAVRSWFQHHRDRINAHDASLSALLSTLLPGMRSDRVYCIQATRLEKIIARGLCLGSSRVAELTRYRSSGNDVDLADCVERVLSITPNCVPCGYEITVEEIDELLHSYAAGIKWSSPSVRATSSLLTQRNQRDLEQVYGRLTPLEGKWFTRLVLKTFEPLIFESNQVFRECHPRLPLALKVREDFSAALELVQSCKGTFPSRQTERKTTGDYLISKFVPQIGTKIGRQTWAKGRSIKHCLDLGHGRVSVEYKADGEYCQIHIDLSKGHDNLKIFSKSGKDSTEDREKLHSVIKSSLNIGKPNCQFQKSCILEGELLVYCDLEKKILPFHRIRNHVTRRGRFLDTDADDRVTPHEHLMILYYDVLLIDDRPLLHVRHSERFQLLSSIVECQQGYAELVSRELVDFDRPLAASNLRNIFAKTITRKEEGLVLKMDIPYFDFFGGSSTFAPQCIKLKKEYIGTFGEVGDFSVVGAGYDPNKAKQYKIVNLKWTHFYLGCLTNREEVKQWSHKPKFTVVKVVEINETLLKSVVQFGNPMAIPHNENTQTELLIQPGLELSPKLTVAFTNPLVFDMRCFNFDKDGNTGFWSLRFPAVSKVHFDRDWMDCVAFDELQEMALKSTTAPDLPDSQENLEWIAKLEGADPRGIAVDAVSQQTTTTASGPSQGQSFQSLRQSTPQLSFKNRVADFAVTEQQNSVGLSFSSLRGHEQGNGEHLSETQTTTNVSQKQESIDCRSDQQGSQTKRHSQNINIQDGRPSPPKRHKPIVGAEDSIDPSSQGGKGQQSRNPLGDISGNHSQARTIISISSQETEINKPEVIDLTLSPEIHPLSKDAGKHRGLDISAIEEYKLGPPTSAIDGHSSTPSQDVEQNPSASPEQGINAPRSHEGEKEGGNIGSQSLQPTFDTTSATVPTQSETDLCIYAARDCKFSNTSVILAPSLHGGDLEVSRLLKNHGVQNVIVDIERWLKDSQELLETTPYKIPQPETIILVDSIANGTEMDGVLSRIEESRKTLPSDRRRWIRIYDWHVLKYVSILEDETITKKYYDGFSDPWTRWYCGLV
ncbi:unnamed protein product [Clonostachys rhizophaga]|uniref:ATP-dependent DNA ligase family profile domain-containing protein n=1 Tax=Clonostachys rhizophaga TaxID=160324 RepID=A0A9N9VU26_9HYPO|nr:unnamed protein product [Clonostachys rhizophaga]